MGGLSYVQVDRHGMTILYQLHYVDRAQHEIFSAKMERVV